MTIDYNKIAIIAGERRVTFSDMLKTIQCVADATGFKAGEKTVIFCENREGWLYALYAGWFRHTIVVPVDVMSTVDDVAYILSDCTPEYIWTSRKKADTIALAKQKSGSEAKVLLIDDYELIDPHQYRNADGNQLQFVNEQTSGLDKLFCNDTEDTALIVYTSGTTGNPKGVMLSFRNMFANVNGVSVEVPIFHPEARTIILLPLHHVLPLVGTAVAPIMCGCGVAICPSMTGPDIMATLQQGEVRIMIGVPRLWQTLFRGIKAKIDASAITRGLYWLCEKVQSRALSRLIFSSVRKKMGGKIEFCVSGGAALDSETAWGLKTLGLDVLEGYGMTETAPIIAFTRPDDIVPGCVGQPLPSVEVKFVNGELCAKGPNLMQGYYNRPEETAAVIDEDGFIHTGDLAHLDDKGRVHITGRTKEIIVLSNGKNVNPTEIEFKLEAFKDMVKEVGVCPDGDKLCAIIVPNDLWADGKSDEEIETLLKRDVLDVYNQSTESYKRCLSLFVYKGDLPRTRMEKLQRFKLPELLKSGVHTQQKKDDVVEPTFEEYRLIKKYIEQEKKIKVKPDDNLETDIALDSLDRVGLQSFIELTFGLKMTAERLATLRTVLALAEHVSDYKTRIEVAETDWAEILNQETSHISLPKSWPSLFVISRFAKAMCKWYFNLKAKGVENIPAEGPFIMAPNHQSYFDGLFVASFLDKQQVNRSYFYAKQQHVQGWFAKGMASHHNIVVLDQSNLKESIQTLGEVLKQGRNVIVFPEGTRTNDGKLGDFKKMFAILSKELGVPVLPVAISGAYEAMPKGQHTPKRVDVTVEYLPVITPEEGQSYDELSEKVRSTIKAALKNNA